MRKHFPQKQTGFQKKLFLPRTTQVVIEDSFEGLVHRLCEPWDLHGLPTKPTEQPVCWPQECQVIKERIRHIEGVSLGPEPLYCATGLEQAPIYTDTDEGEVVYEINKDYLQPFFTFARVGGSSRPLTEAAVNVGQQDNTLIFESRFECGNLQRALKVGEREYTLVLRTDMYTARHTQWFYFQVRNTRRALPYRFTIVNLMKSGSLYNRGMRPLLYSARDAQEGGRGWCRVGDQINYYRNGQVSGGGRPYFSLTWTFQFPHDADTCYFAHCYPYTYSDLQDYLLQVATSPAKSKLCKVRVLCRTLAGNMVYLLTVTNPSRSPREAAAKRAVVLTARVHPGESNSSWMMKGLLDCLLGSSADAALLRDTFLFKIVPMINPDGVIVGNYRCSLAGRDLNRQYRTIHKDHFPPVWYTKRLIKRLLEERTVLLYCDLHGHSRKQNIFMYGCQEQSTLASCAQQRVLPLMLSKNCNDKFSFQSCKFHIKREKEGTGRVVAWRLGVANSYTLEATFCGSTIGKKSNIHFNVGDLEGMGAQFCDTLLDYCDPDESKYSQCLQQLKNQMKEVIAGKMGLSGGEYDSDTPLNEILSCIESSSTGSNSSVSDESSFVNKECTDFSAKDSAQRKKQLKTKRERGNSYLMRKAMDMENKPQVPPKVQPPKSAMQTGRLQRHALHTPYHNGSDLDSDPNAKVRCRRNDDYISGRVSVKELMWVPKENNESPGPYMTPHLIVSPVQLFPVGKTKLPLIDQVTNRHWKTSRKKTIYNVVAVPSSLLAANGYSCESPSPKAGRNSVLNVERPWTRGPGGDRNRQPEVKLALTNAGRTRPATHNRSQRPSSRKQVCKERRSVGVTGSKRNLRTKRGKESRPGSHRSVAITPLWQEAAPRRPASRRPTIRHQATRTVSSTPSPKPTGFHLFPASRCAPESEGSSDSSTQSRSSSASSETNFCSYLDILKILCRCQQRSKGKCFGVAGQEFRPRAHTDSPGPLYSPLGTANILGQSPEVSDEEKPPTSPAGSEGPLLTLKMGLNIGEDAACLGVEGGEQGEDHPPANLFTKGRAGPQMARPSKEELGSFSLVYRKHVKSQGKEEQTRTNSIQVLPY